MNVEMAISDCSKISVAPYGLVRVMNVKRLNCNSCVSAALLSGYTCAADGEKKTEKTGTPDISACTSRARSVGVVEIKSLVLMEVYGNPEETVRGEHRNLISSF